MKRLGKIAERQGIKHDFDDIQLKSNSHKMYLPSWTVSFVLFLFFGHLYLRSLDLRFGTVLNSEVDLDKKRLGIGVMNGFIGGFAVTIYRPYIIGGHTGGHIRVINGFISGFAAII